MKIKELLQSINNLKGHKFTSSGKKNFSDNSKICIVDNAGKYYDFFTDYDPETDSFIISIISLEDKRNQEWDDLISYVESLGFTLQSSIGACPIHLELSHPLGLIVEFHARGRWIMLDAYSASYDENVGEWFDWPNEKNMIASAYYEDLDKAAGCLSYNTVRYYFYMMWSDIKDQVLER